MGPSDPDSKPVPDLTIIGNSEFDEQRQNFGLSYGPHSTTTHRIRS